MPRHRRGRGGNGGGGANASPTANVGNKESNNVGTGNRNQSSSSSSRNRKRKQQIQKQQQEDDKDFFDNKMKKKVVLRRLPPALTEEILLQTLENYKDTFLQWKFCKASSSLDEHAFCRFYILFKTGEDALKFGTSFNNHIFRDSKGHEFVTVVEYAPYQKWHRKKKLDTRAGTIDIDPDYMKFVAALEAPEEVPQVCEPEEKIRETSTPLIEYIKNKNLNKGRRDASNGRRGREPKEKHPIDSPSTGSDTKSRDRRQESSSSSSCSSSSTTTSHSTSANKIAATSTSTSGSNSAKSRRNESGDSGRSRNRKKKDDLQLYTIKRSNGTAPANGSISNAVNEATGSKPSDNSSSRKKGQSRRRSNKVKENGVQNGVGVGIATAGNGINIGVGVGVNVSASGNSISNHYRD